MEWGKEMTKETTFLQQRVVEEMYEMDRVTEEMYEMGKSRTPLHHKISTYLARGQQYYGH